MKKLLFFLLFSILLIPVSHAEVVIKKDKNGDKQIATRSVSLRLEGAEIVTFNGAPVNKDWGEDLLSRGDAGL